MVARTGWDLDANILTGSEECEGGIEDNLDVEYGRMRGRRFDVWIGLSHKN